MKQGQTIAGFSLAVIGRIATQKTFRGDLDSGRRTRPFKDEIATGLRLVAKTFAMTLEWTLVVSTRLVLPVENKIWLDPQIGITKKAIENANPGFRIKQ